MVVGSGGVVWRGGGGWGGEGGGGYVKMKVFGLGSPVFNGPQVKALPHCRFMVVW